ncbi:MAG: hypothetical protein JWQ31_2632 [Mycobacterium sp.]|nr:hypothetical protein [Mycobacterium sp.]
MAVAAAPTTAGLVHSTLAGAGNPSPTAGSVAPWRAHRRSRERPGGAERRAGLKHAARPRDRVRTLEFDDRGAHRLKGVPGEWHLFAVAST